MNAKLENKITRIAALVAVHDRLELTRRCVACLESNRTPDVSLELVVVDDGSTDGTGEWLATQTGITALQGDGNLWFGGATDLGLRFLLTRPEPPDFVLMLNNDTFLRPGAISVMRACASPTRVVAAAHWIEDKKELTSTGYLWRRWTGLIDVALTSEWKTGVGRHQPAVVVDAISTSIVLIPVALLTKADLPDIRLHPHNRYDAILSARLRREGGCFCCPTEIVADHRYGPEGNRTSVRAMRLSRFLNESFRNPRSILFFSGGMALAWETAPSRLEAAWAVALRMGRFVRQLAWVVFNSLRPRHSHQPAITA